MLVSDTEISLKKKKKKSINMVVNDIKKYLLPASNYSTKSKLSQFLFYRLVLEI